MDRIEELKQQAEGAVYEAISVGQFLGEEKQMKDIDLLTLGLLKEKNKYDKLLQALKKYGNHLRDCPYYHAILPTDKIKCTCGLRQALKEAKEIT
ncbi:hypothetical protein LCGC14_0346350 [marine sediment metagenome]|uniref:Uncharacterized protein n=1 Tax=marine sediment metagenome TaxID=412755 RepID=A0A0F9WK67_9ZZZZ